MPDMNDASPISICPSPRQPADTHLHVAMRAFLTIIAGLVVRDALKVTVEATITGGSSHTSAIANLFVLVGATIFLVRVLADNIVYYYIADASPSHGSYVARCFLIICDLTSYGICYAIVARLINAGNGTSISMPVIAWTLGYFASVEALHWLWCTVAVTTVARHSDNVVADRGRAVLLERWRRLSGQGNRSVIARLKHAWNGRPSLRSIPQGKS